MIFILSVSVVSAETVGHGNSIDLDENNQSFSLNDNIDDLGNDFENAGGDSTDNLLENEVDNLEAKVESLNDGSSGNSLNDLDKNDNSNPINSINDNSLLNDGSDKCLSNVAVESLQENGDINGGGYENKDMAKNTTLKILSKNNWKVYGNKNYTVRLLDEDNHPIAGALIKFKIKTPKGKYVIKNRYTDQNGKVILTLNLYYKGIYNIQVSYDGNLFYNPSDLVESNVILYEKTSIRTSREYAYRSSNYAIKLVSSKGTVMSNKRLVVYINNHRYIKATDSKGRIYVKMPSNRRIVKLTCNFKSKDFYESSQLIMKLPVYKRTFTKSLVFALLKGKYYKVLLKGIDGRILKKQKLNITINGKSYIKTTNKKGIAYLRIRLPRGEYEVKVSYGNNSVYGPSVRTFNLVVLDPSGQFKRGLNQRTSHSVSQYLSGGGRATVSKSIRKKAKKLTSKYSTKLEKATAIFNYVRDTLQYEYYANSKYGAYKTLKYKKGNCCDHANLIVALCRAAKIPARYSHAQGCRFKKYGIQGHVWAQIYVNGKWYSADATSYRNSLGHVNNWDTRSYHSFHSYRTIPF